MEEENIQSRAKQFLQKYRLIIILVLIVIVSSLISEHFLSLNNFLNIIRQISMVAIIAVGSCVATAMKAAESLASDGVSAAVINARFIKPLDEELILEAAAGSRLLVTVEEGVLPGGFGSGVSALLHDKNMSQVKLIRIGLPDLFIEHGTQRQLRQKYGLGATDIADRIKEAL